MISYLTLPLLLALIALIYIFLVWNYDYWRKRGVKTSKPTLLLGSFPNLLKQRQHFVDDMNDIYKQFKDSERFVGVFLMRAPQLMVLDPSLAHEVFVTSFKHFNDNDVSKMVDRKKEPLVSTNPFILTGNEWKEQRALVSPGLTGTRIKVAYSVIQSVCHSWCDYINEQMKMAPKDGLDCKDLALRFTSENIADCVLGIKAKSFTDQALPIADNVKIFSADNTILMIYSITTGLFPFLVKFYKPKILPKKCEDFFINLMKQAFSMRTANKVDRQDFLNHLLTLQEKKNLSDLELVSYTMTFLIDGLDTSAIAISHCLLLLARNPQVQQRLYEEIMQNLDNDGELSFEKLNELPYLDACFHESLRIFPPALLSTKVCTEPYEFTHKDGRKLQLEVGDAVSVPIYSIHHDPKYYDESEKYKPERFLPENGGVKKYKDVGMYFGFGNGPRTCLGMRFALVQAKAAISTVVKNFKVLVNPKTKKENRLDPKVMLAMQDGGVWLDFEKRD